VVVKQDFAQFKAADLIKRASLSDLPAPLPVGERIIWQGRPGFRALAWRAFHIREVAIYFAAMFAWRVGSAMAAGQSAADVVIAGAWIVAPALVSFAVLSMLAWLFARASNYTVTSKRVLVQFGVALPMTMNIPLDKITSAALKTYRDGSGDIPLSLADDRGSFVLLWPHVRPWKLRHAQPMLRAVPDAAMVAAKLNDALSGQPGPSAISIAQTGSARPSAMPASAIAAA
jgi:hypothetical protein